MTTSTTSTTWTSGPSAWACGRSSASYSWNRLILGVEASYRWTNLEFDDDDIDIEGDLDQLLVGGFITIRI